MGGDPEGAHPIGEGLGPSVRADGAPSSAAQREDLFRGTLAGGNPAADRGGGSGLIAEQRAFMAAQDQYLDAIGEAVKEMSTLGRNIGASLDQQVDTLDRVAVKTEESDERAKFVTRKAARQAQSSKPKKPVFVKKVAFQVSPGALPRAAVVGCFGRSDWWIRCQGPIGIGITPSPLPPVCDASLDPGFPRGVAFPPGRGGLASPRRVLLIPRPFTLCPRSE